MTASAIKYFDDDLSDMQKLYSCITGYEGPNAPFSSAKDAYYFDFNTQDVKIEYLEEYANNYDIGFFSKDELIKVQKAIDAETNGIDEQHKLFLTLG